MSASYVTKFFELAGRPVPRRLADWEDRVDGWCVEYRRVNGEAEIVEVNLGATVVSVQSPGGAGRSDGAGVPRSAASPAAVK